MKKPASTKSSGNVFADLGLPDADVPKADLIINIADLKQKGLTQAQAAKAMGLAQPDVSKLMRGILRVSPMSAFSASSPLWGKTSPSG
jgi:predicted XRE-type DNA-binding protein